MRAGFGFLAAFILVTGLGLVLYMNFKPGPSIGWNRWTVLADHEVRERDYFFVASFVGWAVWVALGLAESAERLLVGRGRPVAGAIFAVALVPFVLNFRDATRRQGPDATLARDFSRALLNSVPPGGILFTWGDNDTFPLWHAQQVDGIRPDVTIVCLALAETPWYQKQIRDWRAGPVDRAALPAAWRDAPVPTYTGPLHTLDDSTIDNLVPQLADRDYELPLVDGGHLSIPRGTPLYGKDVLLLSVVRQNDGKRPIAWATSASQRLFGAPVVAQGLALVLPLARQDSLRLPVTGPGDAPLDVGVTRALLDQDVHLGALLDKDLAGLDPNIGAMARTLAIPYARVGIALLERADTAAAIPYLDTAAHLAPDQTGLRDLAGQLRSAQGTPFRP